MYCIQHHSHRWTRDRAGRCADYWADRTAGLRDKDRVPEGPLGELVVALGRGLTVGLVIGLIYKLSTGLAVGLSGREISTKTTPNEGIHRSARMAVITGLGAGLGFGLVVGAPLGLGAGLDGALNVGLLTGVIGGLTTGIRYGGRTCLQHLLLRLWLVRNGSAPWRYVKFLDYATERVFLRKVGGGYIFIHPLLQDYFAARHPDPGGGSTLS